MKEVLVIGAGIGGLSAALSLVARGQKVRVLEAHDRPGGKAGVVELEGVEVDTGPSVLTLPEVFDRLFRLAGSSLSEEVELLEPSPAFDYRWPDGTRLKVEVRPEATRAEVRASFEADYPTMGRVDDDLAAIRAAGFSLIDHFPLPDAAWWDDFYTPMEQRIAALRKQHAGDAQAAAILDQLAQEPEIHRRHGDSYAYEFFVARKPPAASALSD